ncbi:acyl-CoA dehydrogenase family protein [Pendulispora rubella]|uniref:Acyl-CoA dehydrogenase family protein n=1 Tax=Pendulispora rubella TaxID=2741070 RepID=A0ABZ2L7N0_9BACT
MNTGLAPERPAAEHLTPEHTAAQAEFQEFVDQHIAPFADEFHRAQRTPPELVRTLAERGLLGLSISKEFGGGGRDAITLGILAGTIGRACSSVRSLLTVHTMVAHAISRWGSRAQKETWLPKLATGERIGALALSEPNAGSDAKSVATRISPDGSDWRIDGHKSWITYGETATLFLVVGRTEEGPTAFLVERETPGLSTELITDLIGIRASMTASVRFDGCRVPEKNLLGRRGLGVSQVASTALDLGRYTVAWGSVGILEACLEASIAYANQRETFGSPIKDHQLIRRMITNIFTDFRAAKLLCLEAGRLRDAKNPGALEAASVAKYFASTAAVRAASDALQIHGANGCSADYPLQRYLGDAKIMEIIEGSTQIQQVTLAEYAYQAYAGVRSRGGDAPWRHR